MWLLRGADKTAAFLLPAFIECSLLPPAARVRLSWEHRGSTGWERLNQEQPEPSCLQRMRYEGLGCNYSSRARVQIILGKAVLKSSQQLYYSARKKKVKSTKSKIKVPLSKSWANKNVIDTKEERAQITGSRYFPKVQDYDTESKRTEDLKQTAGIQVTWRNCPCPF